MNFYQINYLARNFLDKGIKIFKNPRLFGLYFNEYIKGIFINIKIDSYIVWTGSLIFIGVIMVSQSELIETSFVRIFNFFKTIRNRLSSPTSTQIINKE